VSYRIIRFYKDAYPNKRTIARGLTLEDVQAHCQNPESSSSTCRLAVNKRRTKRMGQWFDGYSEER
jgi:hypothetical protein